MVLSKTKKGKIPNTQMIVHTTSSDEDLMLALSQGDLDCAALIFERYQVRLFHFFYKLNQDQALSEDLTQTVFERMIRYRHSYRKQMGFKAWFYQIARNVRADHYKLNRLKVSDFAAIEDQGGEECSVEEKIKSQEQLLQLNQAMMALSNKDQELLLLTRFQKLKYKEVAEILGITEVSVKVQVHRAIKQLKKHFFKLDKQ